MIETVERGREREIVADGESLATISPRTDTVTGWAVWFHGGLRAVDGGTYRTRREAVAKARSVVFDYANDVDAAALRMGGELL